MNERAKRTYVLEWGIVALLLGFAAWLFVRGMSGLGDVNAPASLGVAVVGQALPDAPLVGLDGAATSLRRYVGHPLWINFFATWCPPCKAELPDVARRYNALKSRGLTVLGVDQQESASVVAAFARRIRTTYPIAIDEGQAALLFRVQTIPVSVFVDAGGTIRWMQIGQMSPAAMDAALAKILPRS